MNRKIFSISFIVFATFTMGANAQLKFDVPQEVNGALDGVLEVVDSAFKDVNASAKIFEENQIGDELKAGYEKLMAIKGELEEKVAAGKEKYEEVKGKYEELKGKYEEAKGKIEEAKEKIGSYEDRINGLKESKPVSTTTLGNQISQIEDKMKDRQLAMDMELGARINAVNENIAALQSMYDSETDEERKALLEDELEEAKELLAGYEDDLRQSVEDPDNYYLNDEEYKKLADERGEKQEKLASAQDALKMAASQWGSKLIGDIFSRSPEQKKQAYTELNERNFVSDGEELNDESIKRIDEERWANYKGDIANALASSMNYRMKYEKFGDKVEQTTENIENADYAMTAITLQNKHIINDMETKTDTMDLDIANLRLKTSENILNQGYKLLNPNKNPAQINLDQYEMTRDDVNNGRRIQKEGQK